MNITSESTQISKPGNKPVVKQRFRVNSFGLQLFLVIMGGAMTAMGAMAFLFGETVKYQAEGHIQGTLNNKVDTINEVIDQAETLAYGLNISVATLHVRRAETPETYQELTRKLFKGRPEFVTGLGFGQKEYGILPSKRWFFPYYQASPLVASSSANAGLTEAELAEAQSDGRYVDQVAPRYFYPETERYRNYFLPQIDQWTTPYQTDERGVLLTYYSQIFDNAGEWIGTAVIDVDGTYLSRVLKEPVLRDGGELMLLTATGDVIANPSNPSDLGTQTYENIPGLEEIWDQIGLEASGFLEGETGYWAYTQIPERNWLLVAHVPYGVVFGRVMVITVVTTTAVALLLAGVIAIAISYLNQRLRPVLDECHRLSEIDEAMMEQLQNKDELEQLSLSFFHLLEQLTQQQPVLHQVRSLKHVVMATADEEQQQSQLITQVQQWMNTTDDLSQLLAEQAKTMEEAGNATYAALEVGQQKITSAMTELETFRRHTHHLPEQMQDLLTATDRTTQATQEHHHLINRAKMLVLNAFTLSTRASQQQNTGEFKTTAVQFQRLITQLQQLTEQFSQALEAQQTQRKQVHEVGTDLNNSFRVLERQTRHLTNSIEVSQDMLGRGKATAHHVTHVGEQVTQSSQQLGELVQTIQQTMQNIVAIADATRTRLKNRA